MLSHFLLPLWQLLSFHRWWHYQLCVDRTEALKVTPLAVETCIMLGTWIIDISYCRISTLNGELEKWKTTDCSSGRLTFYSQHPRGSSITPVPGHPILCSGLYGHCMNVVHRYKCNQNILTHKIVLKLKKSVSVDQWWSTCFFILIVLVETVVAFGGDTNWTRIKMTWSFQTYLQKWKMTFSVVQSSCSPNPPGNMIGTSKSDEIKRKFYFIFGFFCCLQQDLTMYL